MSFSRFVKFCSTALIVTLWVAVQSLSVQTQQRGGTVQTDKVQPVNTGANPYRVIRDWAQLGHRGKAVGRLQWRGHRPRRQVGVGDRPMLPGDGPGLSRHQSQPCPPLR